MEVFRPDGHLTPQALSALAGNQDVFSQLERLEAAEHLAFCDACLQRYTDLLAAGPLLSPSHSCEKSLWTRIRLRAFRMITSRYATAAAAVTLALTVLWGSGGRGTEFPRRDGLPEDRPSVSQRLSGLAGDLNDSLGEAVSGLSDFFDGLRPGQFIQGGDQP